MPTTMPPVTLQHRQHAYLLIRPIGVSYDDAMALPEHTALRQRIEHKAKELRTEAWLLALQRTVVPTPGLRLGVDGHPLGHAE